MPLPGQPQSQIETAISLPRPDPAAIWLAQQQAQAQGASRSAGVIIAVVALTVLCVLGIIALLYFKYRAGSAETGQMPDVVQVASAATSAPPPPAPAASSAEPAAAASSSAQASSGSAPAGAGASGGPGAHANAAPPPKDVGYLTLSCIPRCDVVTISGQSFVPPIDHAPFPAGALRVNAKLGSVKKTISVVIVAGEVSPAKIAMQ